MRLGRDTLGVRNAIPLPQLQLWEYFFYFMRYESASTIMDLFEDPGHHTIIRSLASRHKLWRKVLPALVGSYFPPLTAIGEIRKTHIAVFSELARTRRVLITTTDMYLDSDSMYGRRGREYLRYNLWFSLKNIVKGQRRGTLRLPKVEDEEELDPKEESDSCSFYDYVGNKTIGIATDEVQAGDQIVLVSGVRMPLVLRRDGLSNRLVSPALVWRVMNGQMWDKQWKVGVLEEFSLS
jgi:hypothetical protein